MKKIILVLLFAVVSLLYLFRINSSMFFHPDLARDYHEVLKIAQGDLVFLGPKLTFGGLYTGPYYFYLFVPFYLLTGNAIWSIYVFNALLYAGAIAMVWVLFSQKTNNLRALILTILLATNPLIVLGAKNPSNAFSYAPLMIMLVTYLYWCKNIKPLAALFLGFGLGVIFNFHYINIIFLPYFLSELWQSSKKNWLNLGLFMIGGILSFMPLILFEIKNHFVMFKNTFIDKSYLQWVNNQNIPGNTSGKKNPLANMLFMNGPISNYLGFSPLWLWLTALIIKIVKLLKLDRKDWFLLGGAFASFVLFSVIVRFQFIQHYAFGVSLLILLSLLFVATKRLRPVLLVPFSVLILFWQLRSFPISLYRPTWRQPGSFANAVEFVVQKGLVKKGERFNVIQITKERLLATLGFEYRYFFRLHKLIPENEFGYPVAQKLIVFSELPYKDLANYKSWEAEQFGLSYLKSAKRYTNHGLTIFVINKQ